MHRFNRLACLCLIVLFLVPADIKAYSVFTHEALIDVNWERSLVPLLKQKYPSVTTEGLRDAHAYAYGGAVVPDMGYYPTGSAFFTSLVHYSRSGDFIEELLSEARNVNEYAFALGVLCHYIADRYGHPVGINTAVPMIYPKVKKKYGNVVTWADDHISHIRTEFSFDVLQTARGLYASAAYRDFIGFKIADSVLQRAFYKTYGLQLDDLFKNLPRTINIFRWTVNNLFPFITRAAWANKKDEIRDSVPGMKAKEFIYRVKTRNYNKQFEKRDRPGTGAYIAALVIKILPKIGPLRPLRFKQSTEGAERKFAESFDTCSSRFAAILSVLTKREVSLANIDFDTGENTAAGEYAPADDTYHDWLLALEKKGFNTLTTAMQQHILSFYESYKPVTTTSKQRKHWDKINTALAKLKTLRS